MQGSDSSWEFPFGCEIYLSAAPAGHLPLCRRLFGRRNLRLGPFLWIEADLLHLWMIKGHG